jgi:hypothetical protein
MVMPRYPTAAWPASGVSVEDGPLEFELSGRCGYEATFEYSSATA